MEKETLEMVIIRSEDIVQAIQNIDYKFASELRAFFTKHHTKELKIIPSGDVHLYYRKYRKA